MEKPPQRGEIHTVNRAGAGQCVARVVVFVWVLEEKQHRVLPMHRLFGIYFILQLQWFECKMLFFDHSFNWSGTQIKLLVPENDRKYNYIGIIQKRSID